eukprot:1446090-Pyramimonas_sp.AAC.1
MLTLPLVPSVGPPIGAAILVRGVPNWAGRAHADPATRAFGGTPSGATNNVRQTPKRDGTGCPEIRVKLNVNAATGAFDGARYGATARVRGAPK